MNKFFAKIAGITAGLALVASAGVALASHAEVKGVRAAEVTDTITASDLAATATTYTDFSGVSKTSAAVYAGQSAKSSAGAIQLRSKNSNSGIVSTTSGGTVKSVTITVQSGSNAVDVYGSNSAYSAASDLYGSAKGTKVGSVSATGTVTFTDSYSYVGIRSNNGAIYLTSVAVVWDDGQGGGEESKYSVTYDANGGSGTMTDSAEYASGDTVTVLANGFSAPSSFYEFKEFNTKADGSGTAYVADDTFAISKNTTLYAIWSIKDVELGDGSYSAEFAYSDPYPTAFYVKNSSSENVGLVSVEADGLTCLSSYNEYQLAVTGSVTFKNHTNAPLTKIVVNVYQYDNFKLSLGSTVLHTGDGKKGSGDPVVFEITPETPSTDDVVLEHYTGTGTYTQKFYSIEFFYKIGTDVVHTTGVELNAESGNVYIGKTRQLTATVSPANADDKTVTWESSNNSVATVDENGLVSGVAAGEATITATTTDGGFEASFVATVKTLSYGSAESPLSVEEAREVLEINGSSASEQQLFVKGRVYSSSYSSTNGYTIWLKNSAGDVNKYFELFKTTLEGEEYQSSNALAETIVVAQGYGMVYSGTTYELTPVSSVNPSVVSIEHTAESLAKAIVSETKSQCDSYEDGVSDYSEFKSALETVWESLSAKYATISDSTEIDALVDAEANENGSTIEKGVARYDFLCEKYGLDQFIDGRVVPQGRYVVPGTTTIDSNVAISVVAICAIASISAIAVILVIKRRKSFDR